MDPAWRGSIPSPKHSKEGRRKCQEPSSYLLARKDLYQKGRGLKCSPGISPEQRQVLTGPGAFIWKAQGGSSFLRGA